MTILIIFNKTYLIQTQTLTTFPRKRLVWGQNNINFLGANENADSVDFNKPKSLPKTHTKKLIFNILHKQ